MKARVVGYGWCLKEPCNRGAITQALCEHQQEVVQEATEDAETLKDLSGEDDDPNEVDDILSGLDDVDYGFDDDVMDDVDADLLDHDDSWPIEQRLDRGLVRVVYEDSLDAIYDIEDLHMERQYRSRRRYNDIPSA